MRLDRIALACLSTAILLAGCSGAGTVAGAPPQQPTQPPSSPPVTPQLSITTATIPPAKVGAAYSTQLTAANGTGALTWSAQGLPSGLALSPDGVLSGTASTPVCPAGIAVKVFDSSSPAQTATANLQFVAGGLGPNLPQGRVGVYYMGSLELYCGAEPVSWTLVSGSLPAGLQMSPFKGVDSQLDFPGTPTQSGTFNLTVQAQDKNFQYQATMPLTILPAALSLKDGLMQVGVVGRSFDHTVTITGGAPPYTFTLTSGSLPPGLQLNPQTGEITGTPQAPGLSQFTINLTDSLNSSQFPINKPDSILVTPAPLPSRNDTIAMATPIAPGTYYASLSPYTNGSGQAAPDQDYYVLSGVNSGEQYQIGAGAGSFAWNGTYNSPITSPADPAIEIVDANGNRLATCNDPVADSPPSGAPYSAGLANFSDPCVTLAPSTGLAAAFFTFQTSSANQTFYIHVFDFQGRARPDFLYQITVTKK